MRVAVGGIVVARHVRARAPEHIVRIDVENGRGGTRRCRLVEEEDLSSHHDSPPPGNVDALCTVLSLGLLMQHICRQHIRSHWTRQSEVQRPLLSPHHHRRGD